jgi:anti-sigma regulatory factor (Ser/Thr protein kinase)
LKLGIASRPAVGMTANGDTYLIKEWNGQALLGVIDGLGHGEEASFASMKAEKYVLANPTRDVEEIISGLHEHLHGTRGAIAALVRIDRDARRLFFCGIGNVDVSIEGDPQMHPASLEGIIGVNIRKIIKFSYSYNFLKGVMMHSDGISSRFNLSDYPSVYEQPQAVAERIMAEWGKKDDDATIVIAVEEEQRPGYKVQEFDVSSDARALTAAQQAKELAEELGFSEADQSKIAIATSELAKNIVVHAKGNGRIVIKPAEEGGKVGLIVIAEDSGPGISDVESALENGYSTKKGLGIGLGGAKRLMDEFSIETKIGKGTKVTVKKWRD